MDYTYFDLYCQIIIFDFNNHCKLSVIAYIEDMSSYFTYILRCADDTLYTGITTDLERRVQEHNMDDK